MQRNTVGIYYLDSGAPSCLSGVFSSFGVPQQPNGYSNSCVLIRRDLLRRPSSSASIANERQPAPVSSCGPSAVCPPGKKREGQHPVTLRKRGLHRTGVPRRAANDPYDGPGQPLFGLHYPERDKQSFAVSLDNGPKKQISQTFALHKGN